MRKSSKNKKCPGKLTDCPLLTEFREGLKKSISNHVNMTAKNDNRLCKTSRIHPNTKEQNRNSERENLKMSKQKPNESGDKRRTIKNIKATSSNTSRGVIRSTRAHDLRSQSNRDLLKPKTTSEKTRTSSPYVMALPQKKKKCTGSGNSEAKSVDRSNPTKSLEEKKKQETKVVAKKIQIPYKRKVKKEKSSSAGEEVSLQRQKTQEIINPKVVKKMGFNPSAVETSAGDFWPPQLKKSQTFFICKGEKKGKGDDNWEGQAEARPQNDSSSDGNVNDDDEDAPKLKPLTHNDSFCLIVKSSQNWSQKNRSDDEKWLHYGLACDEKAKKTSEKGILKNSSHDLISVDSLEKVESEKIVRFSDELLRNKKVLKKLVRRKKRLQNFFIPNWNQKNKLFQKYLQILREKSVLLSDGNDTPEDLKPFRVPLHVKERYEAEMFGLYPARKGKIFKNQMKDFYSY